MTEGMEDFSAAPPPPGPASPSGSTVDTGQVPEEKPEETEAAGESGEEGVEETAEGGGEGGEGGDGGDGEHVGALGIVALPGACCVCIEMEQINNCLHSEKICILPILACLISLALCTAGLKWVFVDKIFEYDPPSHLAPKPIGQDPIIISVDPTLGITVSIPHSSPSTVSLSTTIAITPAHPEVLVEEKSTRGPYVPQSPRVTDPSVTLKYNAERTAVPRQTPQLQTTQKQSNTLPAVSTTSTSTKSKTSSHVTRCSKSQKNYCVNGGECFTLEIMPGSTKFLCRCLPGFTGHRCEQAVLKTVSPKQAEELYQKRILTITGICIALLVVGIMCVVAYCKTKKQRKKLRERLRQSLRNKRKTKTSAGTGSNLANSSSGRQSSNLPLQDLQLNNCNGMSTKHAAEKETETAISTSKYALSAQEHTTMTHISSQRYISDDDTLRHLEKHSFYNLSSITHIQLTSLKSLSYIDQKAFKDLPNLKYLGITNTGLTSFPNLHYIHSSQEDFVLEVAENALIQVLPANSFTGISVNALTVMLNSNGLKEIQRYAFNGTRLEEVYLQRNLDLEQIDEFAFDGVIYGPTHLDLSETRVRSLPSIGMGSIEKFRAKNTEALKVLPPLRAFLHLQRAELTFPSHCCGLKMLKRWKGHSEELICNLTWAALRDPQDSSLALIGTYLGHKFSQHLNGLPNAGSSSHNPICPTKKSKNEDLLYVALDTEYITEGFDFALCNELHTDNGVFCTPLPDALNPCEDVISQRFLRVMVWVVSLIAISSNLLVLFILVTSRQKLSVTRFLMGHLAFADCCMGMYLLLIACVDFYTRSHYYHYALAWQIGSGCNLAGTLSVFASELSVFTLTSISIQRWNAIFYAMRPERKMRLRHASMLMVIGFLLCAFLALLPVVGVSSYQKVSICLPMDTKTPAAQTYVVSLLVVNAIAFIVVCLCYLHIYCMVHNPQYDSSRCDLNMAKRMAAIIFTNFLCLAPICFYGLSAALHQPLMTITNSKVLLVLFYPLNSCMHPFFYAIMTKAFRSDILMLLSRMGLCQRQAHRYRCGK
ncbi:thyrotropin receptor-like isoform 2-T2 [Pholidichthys leucotaenia]